MAYFTKQNKTVIVAALALFLASVAATLFFLTNELNDKHDLKADVFSAENNASMQDYEQYFNLIQDQKGILFGITLDGTITASFPDPTFKGSQFFSMVSSDDLPSLISAIGKVVSTEEPLAMVGPFRVQDKEYRQHWYMASLYPMKKNEKVSGVIVVARDISENLQPQVVKPQNNDGKVNDEKIVNSQIKKAFSLLAS